MGGKTNGLLRWLGVWTCALCVLLVVLPARGVLASIVWSAQVLNCTGEIYDVRALNDQGSVIGDVTVWPNGFGNIDLADQTNESAGVVRYQVSIQAANEWRDIKFSREQITSGVEETWPLKTTDRINLGCEGLNVIYVNWINPLPYAGTFSAFRNGDPRFGEDPAQVYTFEAVLEPGGSTMIQVLSQLTSGDSFTLYEAMFDARGKAAFDLPTILSNGALGTKTDEFYFAEWSSGYGGNPSGSGVLSNGTFGGGQHIKFWFQPDLPDGLHTEITISQSLSTLLTEVVTITSEVLELPDMSSFTAIIEERNSLSSFADKMTVTGLSSYGTVNFDDWKFNIGAAIGQARPGGDGSPLAVLDLFSGDALTRIWPLFAWVRRLLLWAMAVGVASYFGWTAYQELAALMLVPQSHGATVIPGIQQKTALLYAGIITSITFGTLMGAGVFVANALETGWFAEGGGSVVDMLSFKKAVESGPGGGGGDAWLWKGLALLTGMFPVGATIYTIGVFVAAPWLRTVNFFVQSKIIKFCIA